jgi:3-dehydroquinate synthase
MPPPSVIILTGFSGTGKTQAGPIIAGKLGWQLVDTDELVERDAAKSILEIFRDEGEEAFRDLESRALAAACARTDVVVSTGGGAILRPDNRRLMAGSGYIVCLEARPVTIVRRLQDRAEAAPLDRPLLASADPMSRVREVKEARQPLYALCDWAVHTDSLTPEEVADEVVSAWRRFAGDAVGATGRVEEIASAEPSGAATVTLHAIEDDVAATVHAATGPCPIIVRWGLLAELGSRLREAGLGRHAYVLIDEAVAHHYEDEVAASLASADIPHEFFPVPPGEDNKTLATASGLYDALIERRAERSHTILAIGGGVTTDLGGYVAATFARGLPVVHVPTSVLGMVDAAVGGKTGVNHPQAKNMIGSFYQPRMVLADPAVLRTLPPRELSGWAEAIKHAFIADEDYLRFFEDNADAILKLEPDRTAEAIRRSVVIKAEVVSDDERETTGRRAFLNYGHTLAHAIESTTAYRRFRHGEADGIGMAAAAAISVRMGLLAPADAERQKSLLERFNLPTRAEGLDRDRILAAMALDKKVQGKTIRWVLLEAIGRPVLRDDVPPEVMDAALDEVLT